MQVNDDPVCSLNNAFNRNIFLNLYLIGYYFLFKLISTNLLLKIILFFALIFEMVLNLKC